MFKVTFYYKEQYGMEMWIPAVPREGDRVEFRDSEYGCMVYAEVQKVTWDLDEQPVDIRIRLEDQSYD